MNLRCIFRCIIASVVFASAVYADPENFMIEGLTFQRPTAWQWIVPDSDVRKAQLKVPGDTKAKSADVIFYWFPTDDKQGDADGCVRRWQAQFKERDKVPVTIERSKFGSFKLTYASMEGTYKGFGKEALTLPNHELVGAILETSKGSIMIRMTGPKDIVDQASSGLKKMIEDAVKDE